MTFYMIRIHRVSFSLSSLSTLTVSTNLCYRAGGDSTELTIYWGMYDDSDDDSDVVDDNVYDFDDDCMIVMLLMIKITDLCANYQLMVS